MILVDTSVLIDFFREGKNKSVERFERVLSEGLPFGINVYIYQELLQGTATQKDYRKMKEYLDTQVFYQLHNGLESYARAARLYFDCRRVGYTVSSSIDCLVAQTALENNLFLLHNDADYDRIAKVAETLKIYNG
jgi:predicted nucleic acid-binding protein